MLGLRVTFLGAQAAWLTDGTADWFWPAAEKAGLAGMFLTNGKLPEFVRIAERHPQLPLIVDHMGLTVDIAKNNMIPTAIDQAVALAKYPNVSVLFVRTISVPRHDPAYPPAVRCVRPSTLLLGDRHDQFVRQGQLSSA